MHKLEQTNISCYNCEKSVLVILSNYNSNIHDVYCDSCIKSLKVCSKNNAKKLLLLNESDLKNTKCVYNNKNVQCYIYEVLEQIMVAKYGGYSQLMQIFDKKKNEKIKRNKKKEEVKNKREKELRMIFLDNKLEFKNYGYCYSYIHYGKPSLEEVLEKEIESINDQNDRRIKLAKELSNYGLLLDETNKYCYEYIYGIRKCFVIDVVNDIIGKQLAIGFANMNNFAIFV